MENYAKPIAVDNQDGCGGIWRKSFYKIEKQSLIISLE